MKHILILSTIIFMITPGFSQLEKIKIDPDQRSELQYIAMSSNLKNPFSNVKHKAGRYETKGAYYGVKAEDFANALANYLNLTTPEEIGEQISDSLAAINVSLPFYELVFTLTRDVGLETFDMDTIYNSFPGTFTLGEQTQIWAGFQINYDGCGQDGVDCSVVDGNNRLIGSSPSGWAVIRATVDGFMYILPYANTDSFVFSCFRADGTQCQDADFSSAFVYQFHLRYMIE